MRTGVEIEDDDCAWKRSLNSTSTVDGGWCWVHPPPPTTTFTIHYPSSLQTAAFHPHPPLPSPEGCGPVPSGSTGGYEGRNTRGDPGSGRPSKCVAKTGHDFCRGSFSPFSLSPPPTKPLFSPNSPGMTWAAQQQRGGPKRQRERPNNDAKGPNDNARGSTATRRAPSWRK